MRLATHAHRHAFNDVDIMVRHLRGDAEYHVAEGGHGGDAERRDAVVHPCPRAGDEHSSPQRGIGVDDEGLEGEEDGRVSDEVLVCGGVGARGVDQPPLLCAHIHAPLVPRLVLALHISRGRGGDRSSSMDVSVGAGLRG